LTLPLEKKGGGFLAAGTRPAACKGGKKSLNLRHSAEKRKIYAFSRAGVFGIRKRKVDDWYKKTKTELSSVLGGPFKRLDRLPHVRRRGTQGTQLRGVYFSIVFVGVRKCALRP